MIKIVADSTCDLSPELIDRYGVTILPLHVLLGDKEYRDGVDITIEEIYSWADEHKTTPKTSAPGVDDAVNVFRKIIEEGDEIIAFSISSSMSASYEYMQMAAGILKAADKISVIDSANLSTGIGLLVVEAAEMAAEGRRTREEIIARIEELKPLVRASFVVDTLVYLHRGGRCSGVAAIAGTALKLHPKIMVENGAMRPDKKYRGKYSNIVLEYAKDMEELLKTAKKDRVFITHSPIDPAVTQAVREYLQSLNRFDEILETTAGGVISSHCGPGTLGVLFIAEDRG
ncbi:MAG: DegV family protein [Lachnospiraceae bacterium]|nr:DegV family protein [Lachnospiraceae bacterium]